MKTKLYHIFTIVMLFSCFFAFSQQSVTGLVTDSDGVPIPGATVNVKESSTATTTDFDGRFTINASMNDVLVVSYVGYVTQEVSVTGASVEVALTSSTALDEVVITGFGEVTRQAFTGSAKVVAGETLQKKSFTNITQALSGESPGVAVFNTSGQPGSSSTIRIRGFGSVNGSRSPLVIVDDSPFLGSPNDINPNDIKSVTILKDASATTPYGARGANGVIVITTKRGSDRGDKLTVELKSGTNYQGIDRYEVIKSPEEYIGISWEAAYQRGMLQDGATNDSAIAYANDNLFENDTNDDFTDISQVYNMWNVANVGELIDPATASVRPGVTRRYNPENWEDYSLQSANRNEALLTFSESSDNSSLYTSFGFIDDKGYAINTDYNRLNARIAATQKFADFINLNTTINYSQSESNNNGTGSSSSSQFWWLDNIPNIYPLFLRDADGNKVPDPIYGGYQYDYGLEDGRGFGFATNGVADSYINISRGKSNSVNFNNDLRIDIADGLTLENNFGYQYFMSEGISLDEPFYSPAKGQGGQVTRSRSETKNWTTRTNLRYLTQFDDFDLSVILAHVASQYDFNYLYAERTNLVMPQGTDISNGVVNAPGDGYTDELTTESYIANFTLNYQEKYYLSGTFNRDGSSRFKNDPWGDFYGLGASWIASKEDFFSSDLVNFLKLKASYGVIGNAGGVGLYPGYNIYSVNNLNDNISLAFLTKGNKDLTWESSNQFNIGTEFEIANRVEGSLEFYNKKTTDMFFDRRVGPSVGYALITVNDGELVNTGIEFDLDVDVFSNDDFSFSIGMNGESFTNELTAMPIDPATGLEQNLDVSGRYGRQKGRSLYDFYIPVYTGVNPDTGAAEWERYYDDVNGNGTFDDDTDVIITSLEQYRYDNPDATLVQDTTDVYADAADQFSGYTAIPDLRGAFSLNATYGRFTFNALFNYQFGGHAYDFAYAALMDNDFLGTNNYHVDIRNRWKAAGDVTDIPRLDGRAQLQQNSSSTRFLTKADYIALNNIRLAYDVPEAALKTVGIDSANIYVSGDNLWLKSDRKGFNPSNSVTGTSDWYRYNPLSTIVFGLKLNL